MHGAAGFCLSSPREASAGAGRIHTLAAAYRYRRIRGGLERAARSGRVDPPAALRARPWNGCWISCWIPLRGTRCARPWGPQETGGRPPFGSTPIPQPRPLAGERCAFPTRTADVSSSSGAALVLAADCRARPGQWHAGFPLIGHFWGARQVGPSQCSVRLQRPARASSAPQPRTLRRNAESCAEMQEVAHAGSCTRTCAGENLRVFPARLPDFVRAA
jgi:hypothetical protein